MPRAAGRGCKAWGCSGGDGSAPTAALPPSPAARTLSLLCSRAFIPAARPPAAVGRRAGLQAAAGSRLSLLGQNSRPSAADPGSACRPLGAGRGVGLGAAPARDRCRRCPEGAAGHRPAKRDRPNARRPRVPRAGLAVPRFPEALSRTAKLTNLGQGWRPLRSARRQPRTALGLGQPRGTALLGAGVRGVRPGGSAAPSRCHNLLPQLVGVPFGLVGGEGGQAGDGRSSAAASPRPPTDGSARAELRGGRSGRSRAEAPATASCPGGERSGAPGRRMLGGGSCLAAPAAASGGGRRGEQVRLRPGPLLARAPRPPPGTAAWLTRPGRSRSATGGRGEGRHRTRGSKPARPSGCPPARRAAAPAPGGGAVLRCLQTSCGYSDRGHFSSAGTEPHGWLSWRADCTPSRLCNGLLLGGVPSDADPMELASTGICQTPSSDALWSDLLC